jgi:hypothetical protein
MVLKRRQRTEANEQRVVREVHLDLDDLRKQQTLTKNAQGADMRHPILHTAGILCISILPAMSR